MGPGGGKGLVSSGRGPAAAAAVAQSCLTLRDPMDCSLPGSSVHGILQARVLEWVAISFSREGPWIYLKGRWSLEFNLRFST